MEILVCSCILVGKLREKKEMRGRLEKGWKKMKREKRRDNGGEVDEK